MITNKLPVPVTRFSLAIVLSRVDPRSTDAYRDINDSYVLHNEPLMNVAFFADSLFLLLQRCVFVQRPDRPSVALLKESFSHGINLLVESFLNHAREELQIAGYTISTTINTLE